MGSRIDPFRTRLAVSGARTGKDAIEAWCRHFTGKVPMRAFQLPRILVPNIRGFFGTNVIAGESNCVRCAPVAATH